MISVLGHKIYKDVARIALAEEALKNEQQLILTICEYGEIDCEEAGNVNLLSLPWPIGLFFGDVGVIGDGMPQWLGDVWYNPLIGLNVWYCWSFCGELFE